MTLRTFNRRNKKELKWPKIIIVILSTIGVVDTGSITLKNWGLFTSLSCPGIQNGSLLFTFSILILSWYESYIRNAL